MKSPALVACVGVVLASSAWGFSQFSGSGAAVKSQISQVEWRRHLQEFPAKNFVPSKNWLGLASNQHWQTIVSTGALQKVLFGTELQRSFSVLARTVKTLDNDEFEVEFTADHFRSQDLDDINNGNFDEVAGDTRPIVVLLHGLEANAKGNLMTKMAEAYLKEGFGVVLVNFRGCNGIEPLNVGAYHMGFTNDVNQLTKFLHKKYPNRPLYLSGFSLGGNVSLKFLGELGETAQKERNVRGAVTMSVPYDLVESGGKIDRGFNRIVYAGNFLRTLIKKAERQHEQFGGNVPYDIDDIRRCRTIGDFDDAFISKIYGFRDKVDYYTQNQAKGWLPKIRVPCISINAIDDPFIEASSLPTDEEHVKGAPVRLIFTEEGGHCGFVDANNNDRWIAEEMARAMAHIHRGYENL